MPIAFIVPKLIFQREMPRNRRFIVQKLFLVEKLNFSQWMRNRENEVKISLSISKSKTQKNPSDILTGFGCGDGGNCFAIIYV